MADSAPDRLDIVFSVPCVHRLRFTDDVLGSDQDVLLDLLEPSGNRIARVQFWVDEHVAGAQPGLVEKLEAYGVTGRVDEIHPGPVVTMYEFEPKSGTKISKIAGLADDTIDVICSGHAPRSSEKKMRELDQAPFGMATLETTLACVATYLVHPGKLDWPKAIAKLTIHPARVLGLAKGTLKIDADADVTHGEPPRVVGLTCTCEAVRVDGT